MNSMIKTACACSSLLLLAGCWNAESSKKHTDEKNIKQQFQNVLSQMHN